MFQIGYWDVQQILQFLGYAEVFHDSFSLFAEVPVDAECCLGVNVRHFEVMLCGIGVQ
jgi:hypothetical protein